MDPTKEDLEFLWWLRRFVGTWRVGDEDWYVARARDGYLWVFPMPDRPDKPLSEVLRDGVRVAVPASPLGPYPVILSDALMQVWLTPDQYRMFSGPGVGPAKVRRLVEALEQRILELDEEEQKQRWFVLWTHFARKEPSEHDEPIWQELRAEFERETGHRPPE